MDFNRFHQSLLLLQPTLQLDTQVQRIVANVFQAKLIQFKYSEVF